MEGMERIGILTSGGDCPGMNTAVRAAVFASRTKKITLLGIQQGYQGLYDGNWDELTLDKVDSIHSRGGTVLRSARFAPFSDPERRQHAIDRCVANCKGKIDGLVVMGGDGSFRGARDLTLNGLPCVCLPGTIDNDIACTDYTIGYDTALNNVMHMADTIADTARSHDRCMILEVMGNRAGDLTLYGGLASGATAVMIMEHGGLDFPRDGVMAPDEVARFEQSLMARIRMAKAAGKKYYMIFIAEGITGKKDQYGRTLYPGGVDHLAKVIQAQTGIETRADVLAYVQRGGLPSARDRVIATQMGDYAVNLLARGVSNRVVVIHNEVIMDYDIYEALKMPKALSKEDYELAWRVSL
jgi:6-phosphofructokinase 1